MVERNQTHPASSVKLRSIIGDDNKHKAEDESDVRRNKDKIQRRVTIVEPKEPPSRGGSIDGSGGSRRNSDANVRASLSSIQSAGSTPITYIRRKSVKVKKEVFVPKYPFMHVMTNLNGYEELDEHASLTSAGYARCLEAHMNFRAQTKPLICTKFEVFEKQYDIIPKQFRCRNEFFEISQCRDKATFDLRGLKVYRKAELSEESIWMIKREIDATMKMDHPNICRVYHVLEDEKKIYLIIDDLRGKSLFHYII